MTTKTATERRDFLRLTTAVGASLILAGCQSENSPASSNQVNKQTPSKKDEGEEVTATEDLMREHGILRRALLVYTETAVKLRSKAAAVPPDALQKTAKLFRAFGEDYHEKKLEEGYIFPAVKKAGGQAAGLADILIAQHQRGREITDYILAVTAGAKLGTNGEQLARAFDSLVRMYRAHAAREDTIIFPAWKETLSPDQLDEMAEEFEDIEHEQFGEDGFETAAKQIGEIEGALGLGDLAQFTAPPPPAL
ncbi:MAG TPA: hemerythrin domain-containing protein [Blastocatellia bacterium]|jgi:hemerythrin-like domain-containing protein